MNTDTLSLWLLALAPGFLHPFLLYIYFRRYAERKHLISRLLERSARIDHGQSRGEAGRKQKEEWQGNLDLDLASYILPVLIVSAITVVAAVVVVALNDKSQAMGLPKSLLGLILLTSQASIAGFAGAFVWGLYDFVDRFRTLSLPPGALHVLWFRLILGAVLGAYAQQLLAKDFAPVLLFAMGAIPVPAIIKWLQDIADKRFSMGIQAAGVAPKWELVQGLTPDMIARLNEVGVTSVAHLGNQDPVNLLRKTNIEWRNILDMMDQAYLAIYVDQKIDRLRTKGVRGAIELAVLWQRINDTDPNRREDAEKTVRGVASDLGVDESDVRNMIQNLWEEPQVGRIWALWWNDDANDPTSFQDRQRIVATLETTSPVSDRARTTAAG